jgi:DNA-binding MarR family transcriptional regulator
VGAVNEDISDSAARSARELRVVVSRLRRRLNEIGGSHELTPSQVSVVSRLDRDGPASASDLAAAERIRPQSMATVLAALAEQGWIERRPDPEDGRKQLVSLSAGALERLHDSRSVRVEWLSRALQDRYTEDERQAVLRALSLLDRLTQL